MATLYRLLEKRRRHGTFRVWMIVAVLFVIEVITVTIYWVIGKII